MPGSTIDLRLKRRWLDDSHSSYSRQGTRLEEPARKLIRLTDAMKPPAALPTVVVNAPDMDGGRRRVADEVDLPVWPAPRPAVKDGGQTDCSQPCPMSTIGRTSVTSKVMRAWIMDAAASPATSASRAMYSSNTGPEVARSFSVM